MTDGALLARVVGSRLDVPFIIVSGYIGEEAAVAAMREGAHDYVPKLSLSRLGVAVRAAVTDASERAALRQRERDLEAQHAVAFAGNAFDAVRLASFTTDRTRELLRVDTASLFWFDQEERRLHRIARSSTGPESAGDGPPEHLLSERALTQRETVVVDMISAISRFSTPAATRSRTSRLRGVIRGMVSPFEP